MGLCSQAVRRDGWGVLGDAQRIAVAHGSYGSSAQGSIHGPFTQNIKWQLCCIKKAPDN